MKLFISMEVFIMVCFALPFVLCLIFGVLSFWSKDED